VSLWLKQQKLEVALCNEADHKQYYNVLFSLSYLARVFHKGKKRVIKRLKKNKKTGKWASP
jgi:hypothetical protein